jgi:hypothetical protein
MIPRTVLGLVAIAFLFIHSGLAQADDERKRIVIGEARIVGSCSWLDQGSAEAVMISLRNLIGQSGAFRVVSKSQMKSIIKEHELNLVGLVDEDTAKSLGKFAGADLVLSAQFICLPGGKTDISAVLTDVEKRENVFQRQYPLKKANIRGSLRKLTDMVVEYARSGRVDDSRGRTEMFQEMDSRDFYDASDAMVKLIRNAVPRAEGSISEKNFYAKTLKVDIRYSGRKPWAGLKLAVLRDDEEIGWVYLKESGRGELEAGTLDDLSLFEEGDRVSSEDFEPVVAFGPLVDEGVGDEDLVEAFKERMTEVMEQLEGVRTADSRKVSRIINRMGMRVRPKALEKLHRAGVDLLITGRFLGSRGDRRLDCEAISTFDGKRVIEIKIERLGL